MSGSLLERAIRLLELLAAEAPGLRLNDVSERLGIPKSAAHRLLAELSRFGYVRQNDAGAYLLTTKVLSLGYAWLSSSGVADMVQPILDRLAGQTGELVRYAVVDGDRLTWVAKAQGARFGLRLDPDQGMEAMLFCTATGHAWLSTMPYEEAARLVLNQGFGNFDDFGPNAPRSLDALRAALEATSRRGYAVLTESNAIGTAAMAVPVRHPASGATVGVLGISGPSARWTEQRMHEAASSLIEAAEEIGMTSADALVPLASEPRPPIGRGSVKLTVRPSRDVPVATSAQS